jgi:hypothetical protein
MQPMLVERLGQRFEAAHVLIQKEGSQITWKSYLPESHCSRLLFFQGSDSESARLAEPDPRRHYANILSGQRMCQYREGAME